MLDVINIINTFKDYNRIIARMNIYNDNNIYYTVNAAVWLAPKHT